MGIRRDKQGEVRYTGGISYPEAYKVPKGTTPEDVDKLKPEIVKAASERVANRPDTKNFEYLCPGCLAHVHYVKGTKRKTQPKKVSPQPNYGRPFFRHNPNTLNTHLAKAAPILVADIGVVIDNIAVAQGWTYENLETYSTTARRIALTNPTAPGKPLRTEFIIAPNRTSQIPEDFDGVVITTTDAMREKYRCLLVTDSKQGPLTAEKLHEVLHGTDPKTHPANWLQASGFLVPGDASPNGRPRFEHQPKTLITAMVGLMDGTYRFVEHADIVPDYFLPTHNHFVIAAAKDVEVIQKHIGRYTFVLSRENASHQIVAKLDSLSRGSNNVSMPGTHGKYRYGKADFVTFTPYTQGRHDGLVQESAKKILINPESWNLPDKFSQGDWENTLVIFFEAPALAQRFRHHSHFAKMKQLSGFEIRETIKGKNLEVWAREHLGIEPLFETGGTLDQIQQEMDSEGPAANRPTAPGVRGVPARGKSDVDSTPSWEQTTGRFETGMHHLGE